MYRDHPVFLLPQAASDRPLAHGSSVGVDSADSIPGFRFEAVRLLMFHKAARNTWGRVTPQFNPKPMRRIDLVLTPAEALWASPYPREHRSGSE